MTYFAWQFSRRVVEDQVRSRFRTQCQDIKHDIGDRVQAYMDSLYGAQALFAASRSVERDEWHAYVKTLDLMRRYLGIESIEYIEKVSPADRDIFLKNVRADLSLSPLGYPDFAIHPEGIRDFYYVVKYVEPIESRQKTLGFDLGADPSTLAILEITMDKGELTATTPARFDAENDLTSGIMMFLPIYKNGRAVSSMEEKRAALSGFAAIRLESDEFFSKVLGKGLTRHGILFQVSDNDFLVSLKKARSTKTPVIYRNFSLTDAENIRRVSKFSEGITLEVGGHIWEFDFYPTPDFRHEPVERFLPWFVLIVGLIVSSLISWILYLFVRTGERALSMAEEIAKDLSESEERTRLVIDTAMDAVITMDENGVIVGWNKQAETTFGWKAAEAIGRGLSELIIPEAQRQAHREGLKRFLKTNQGPLLNRRTQVSALRRDGEEVHIEICISPFTHKGKYIFSAFIRDLSERKRFESQLLQAQKMEVIGTLAGGIAHDLNNQLTPVLGYLDIYTRRNKDKDIAVLLEAQQAAMRCAEIIQRIKHISRPSTQQKSIIQVGDILDEIKKLLPAIFPSKVTSEIVWDQDLWPILGNDREIETVLMNLMVNARDAMKERGGQFTIEAHNADLDYKTSKTVQGTDRYIYLKVQDTGTGIDPKSLSKLFQPFFTTKKHKGGTGLGLFMVLNIITSHQGWIDVASAPGEGTSFLIYLPARPGAQEVKKLNKEPRALPGGDGLILFVDDEEYMRNIGKVFLERLGYSVLTACDGEECIKVYGEHRAEVRAVVLDMTMPKMTGREILKKILEINPKARVLVSSGHTTEGSRLELIRAGAADFLEKPYTIAPFAQALHNMLSS